MRQATYDFAVITKICSFCAVLISTFLVMDYRFSGLIALLGFAYLTTQRKWQVLLSFVIFYVFNLALLVAIRHCGLRTVIIPEFYILLFWNLLPITIISWDLITTPPGELSAFLSSIKMPIFVILGVLVIFRFLPTMKAELNRIISSMKNRGLLDGAQILKHPIYTAEYVCVPLLIRSVQIADQMALSAITRGAQAPNRRHSYYQKKMRRFDYLWLVIWSAILIISAMIKGIQLC